MSKRSSGSSPARQSSAQWDAALLQELARPIGSERCPQTTCCADVHLQARFLLLQDAAGRMAVHDSPCKQLCSSMGRLCRRPSRVTVASAQPAVLGPVCRAAAVRLVGKKKTGMVQRSSPSRLEDTGARAAPEPRAHEGQVGVRCVHRPRAWAHRSPGTRSVVPDQQRETNQDIVVSLVLPLPRGR